MCNIICDKKTTRYVEKGCRVKVGVVYDKYLSFRAIFI